MGKGEGIRIIIFALLVAAGCRTRAPLSGNRSISSFRQAKRALAEIYAGHRRTIYCGCAFDEELDVDIEGCGFLSKRNTRRARRVEWEHVVPASRLGRMRSSWRDGHERCADGKGRRYRGRRCARKVDATFRRAEADLHNLFPAIGELNGRRSSFVMAEIPGEARDLGACDVEIEQRRFEPRPEVRGEIARAHLYMDRAYPELRILDPTERELMERWSKSDPVDAWECERNRRIAAVQGNTNLFVESACRKLEPSS